MTALQSKYGTGKAAFGVFSNDDTIGKKEWKKIIKRMLPIMPQADAKALRKKLPKKVNLAQFSELMGEVKPKDEHALASKGRSHT